MSLFYGKKEENNPYPELEEPVSLPKSYTLLS
jgi:hypothetical protein